MSRRVALAIVGVIAAAAPVFADEPAPAPAPAPEPPTPTLGGPEKPTAPPDMSDQAIGAELGVATGGRVTAGGLRVGGHYLYQLNARDWFDGTAGFTFGGNTAACFRDRNNAYVCDHGLAQGDSLELEAGVRHFLAPPQAQFWPFVRAGIGLRLVRFGADGVTGATFPLHLGGGIRASVTPAIALTVQGAVELGFGGFNHALGLQPQLGVAVTAGVEFRL